MVSKKKIVGGLFVLFILVLLGQHAYVHSSDWQTSSSRSSPTKPDLVVEVSGTDGLRFSGAIMVTSGFKTFSKSVDGTVPARYDLNDVDSVSISFQKSTGRSDTLVVRIYDPQSKKTLAEESTTASYGLVTLFVYDPT